ncbi:hypothetical protein SAMN04487967_1668 [Natronorubrum sediminis]|uniref:Small CPxCG-related zinc finger protein n=1 Tax=Natronorubrum sediminis TaxID=640943 RepID=A0A1H6FWN0_9EURY|nr:HVO_2523 family zinc finger protein [Natronorubrum sediminis]SEH14578.1 hypothetical protein SAMN04487967_1668 [Natronorubrum sediminis]
MVAGEEGNEPRADKPAVGSNSSGGPRCPRCESELFKRHCKYVCPQHGVVFDCADTFW